MDIEEVLNSNPMVYREIMNTLGTSFNPLTIKEIAEEINQSQEVVFDIVKSQPNEIIEKEYDELKQEHTGRYLAGKQWDFYLK